MGEPTEEHVREARRQELEQKALTMEIHVSHDRRSFCGASGRAVGVEDLIWFNLGVCFEVHGDLDTLPDKEWPYPTSNARVTCVECLLLMPFGNYVRPHCI
jgi:hypothetical protein